MKLEEVLNALDPVKGYTTIIASLMSGDMSSVNGIQPKADLAMSTEQARKNQESAKKYKENCKSDWSYWGFLGDETYWETIANVLEAAQLVGPDNLPDIPLPRTDGVVMDNIAYQQRYGRAILAAAIKIVEDKGHRVIKY